MGDEQLALAAGALAQGCTAVCVTLGARGAAYFTGTPTRTALVPVEGGAVLEGDPTGCGDVFGATVVASLGAGCGLEEALRRGTRLAMRSVSHRGARGLRHHLLGKLTTV